MSKQIYRIYHDNYSHGRRPYARTRAPENQKEKLNGRKMFLYRSVREMPFGNDKTDGSRAKNPEEQKRFVMVPYGTVPYR